MPSPGGSAASADDAGAKGTLSTGESLAADVHGLALVTLAGLSLQFVAFWFGYRAAASTPAPARPTLALVLALVGLLGAVVAIGSFWHWIQRDWLSTPSAGLLVGLGVVPGVLLANRLTSEVQNAWITAMGAYELGLLGAASLAVLLPVLAFAFYAWELKGWRVLLLAPVLVLTGAHLPLLLALLLNAGGFA